MRMITPLLTDLYQLTMADAYWKNGMQDHHAVFHLFYRKAPFGDKACLTAGTQEAVEFLSDIHFSPVELDYLATLTGADGAALFSSDFLDYLAKMHWQLDAAIMPEGEIAFPHQPIMRVSGPLIQCQLVETALLNLVNFQTLIATKAARICDAAGGDPVIEFGLRRAQGFDGGLSASRAAYIGGCNGTSNVYAGQKFGIPVKGTHAHSWVMSFDSETDAFRAYAEAQPNNTILLVDTYDTIEGVKKAAAIGLELEKSGHPFLGIRLDSGDLAALSIAARKILDEAGLEHTKIVASNDLDEYSIRQIKQQGAKIDTWGVGTKLVTAYDQPALGGVYKMGAIKAPGGSWQGKMKFSNDTIKTSYPGHLQVARQRDPAGAITKDTLYDCQLGISAPHPDQQPLLVSALENGQLCRQPDALDLIRKRAILNWQWLQKRATPELAVDPQVDAAKARIHKTKAN